MAEAGSEGGGAAGEGAPSSTTQTAPAPVVATGGEGKPNGEGAPSSTTQTTGGEGKPNGEGEPEGETTPKAVTEALKAAKAEGKEGAEGKDGDPKDQTKPEVKDEDYEKALKVDEKEFGKDFQIDQGLFKRMIPALKEAGIDPETSNKLTNLLAKAQLDEAKVRMQARIEDNKARTRAAEAAFDEQGWNDIAHSIKTYIPANSAEAWCLQKSELGNSIPFLTILQKLGEYEREEDGGTNAGAGAGKAKDVSLAAQLGI